jgi:TolA-binding protein
MKTRGIVLVTTLLIAMSAIAQPAVRLPDQSPGATVGQTIGITDVNITYHRPAVNKRKIFGALVPYGVLWRAGANQNSTISFSTPVKVEGQTLPAGTYGLFMIPGPTQWTVVFSKFTGDWGTYNYDQSEDAARVAVTPQTMTDSQERMAFAFDDLTSNSATAALRWEKLRVPFKIEVDVPATVRANLKTELRGGKHWNGDAWAAAARFELRNGDVDTALKYADTALALGNTTNALRTKAAVLEKKGDTKGAADLRARAAQNYNEGETLIFGASPLIDAKKYDEAITFVNNFIATHPNSVETWRAYSFLGQIYAEKGDQANAKANFDKAMSSARQESERVEVYDTLNALAVEGKY